MRLLCEFADLVRAAQRRLRFGELSRAPLRLLRIEWRAGSVECDWMTRPPDAWDADLAQSLRESNESMQALADAMAVRDLLLEELPGVGTARLRAFRASERPTPEMVIAGTVSREAPYVLRTPSPVMRAKLFGFRFRLENSVLKPLLADASFL